MSTYHLHNGETVELPTHSVLLDLDILTQLVYQQPRRRIGRIITAVVSWFNGDLSPINLTEYEWYIASVLYKGASDSLTKYNNRLKPATDEDLDELAYTVRQKSPAEMEAERMLEMVRESRRKYKEKHNIE